MSCYTDGMECPKCYCIPCNCASTPDQGAATSGGSEGDGEVASPAAPQLPPHTPDYGEPGRPTRWCERCRVDAANAERSEATKSAHPNAARPAPVRGDETTMTDWRVRPGRLTWAEARSILLQGTAMQQDYAAGRYASYEDFSARMDAAAREIVDGSPFAEPEATPKDHPLSAAARASGDAETREDAEQAGDGA